MKKYFVIGNPINHSLSPRLHNYWFKENNIKAIYDKKKVVEKDLQKIISEIKERKINGINVTVPLKKAVIPYLDKLSPEAEQTQSVNTIYMDQDNVVGHNTDIEGFEKAIEKINFKPLNKRILILGAGGVVPSLIYALKKMNVSKIIISNRTRLKAESLSNLFSDLEILDWGNLIDFDMIINATSLGLMKNDKFNIDFSKISKNKLFYDVIYNPTETNFLKIGKQFGNATENGKLMFIYQAIGAFNLWHKTRIEIDDQVIKLLSI